MAIIDPFNIQTVPGPFKFEKAAQVNQECRYLDKILQSLERIETILANGGGGGGLGITQWVPVLSDISQYQIPVNKRLREIKFFDSINNNVNVKVGTTPGGNDIADEILPQNEYRFVIAVYQWIAPQMIYFSGHSSATLSWLKLETLP